MVKLKDILETLDEKDFPGITDAGLGYSNKEVDSLIENANHTFDLKKHQKILQKISEIIYEDQPYTFLVETKYYLEGLNPRIDAIEVVEKYAGSALTLDLLYLKK